MEKIPTLSVLEFCDFIAERFDDDIADAFRANKIAGSTFLKLSDDHMGKMVAAIGDVIELQALQSKVLEVRAQVCTCMSPNSYY